MNNAGDWFQVFAAIGVLAGLVLVAYELDQSKSMTLSAIGTEGFSNLMDDQRSIVGENPAETIARACLHPENLTESDFFILQALYQNRMTHLFSMVALQELGNFELAPYIKLMAQIHFTEIARTKPGRAWLNSRKWTTEQMGILQEVLLANPEPDCESLMRSFMEGVK